jgi:hypothetical protein
MKIRHVYSTPDLEKAQLAIQAARRAGISNVRGLAEGGATGLLAGLVAMAIPPLGVTLAGAMAVGAVSALVGAWTNALMGASTPDPVRQAFEQEIESGRILVVIDGEGVAVENADKAVVATGAIPLPFEKPTVLS